MSAQEDFKETFDVVCGPGDHHRVDFRGVLGITAIQSWTSRREKEVVGVIMELIGAGLTPDRQLEALNLAELGVVPMPHPSPLLPATTPEPPRA